MLEFVHLTGDAAGKDLLTRRKVRSQAMRDFRRRQRAERDAANKTGSAAASKSPSPTLRDRSASEGSRLSSRGIRKSPDPTKPTSLSSSVGEPLFSVLPLTSPPGGRNATPSPQIPEQWSHRSRSQSTRTQSDTLHAAPALSKRYPRPMPRASSTPDMALADDPFKSPKQIAQMFGFCKSYIHWLQPTIDPEVTAKVMADAWTNSHCPMLLAACCLATVGHLDAVQPNRPAGDYALYKARVLQELSERMRTPQTAVSDETMGTLACLLSFEMSKGSAEATMHLRGLSNIVSIHGGLNSLGVNPSLSMMIECLDLIHATMFDAKLMITTADPGSRGNSPDLAQSDADLFDRMTPLLIAEQEDLQQSYHTPHSMKLQQTRQLLAAASKALRDDSTAPQDFLLFGQDSASAFREALDSFGQQSIRGVDEMDDSHQLARACHLTLVLFHNLAINKTPYRHASNQQSCRWLCDAARNVKHETWQLVPYFRLWILLTGIVTSTDHGTQSFFKAQIARAAHQMGLAEWRRVKHFILRFMEMKQALERPSRRSTPPVEKYLSSLSGSKSHLCPAWALDDRDNRRTSVYSSLSSTGTREGTGMAFGSPHMSRAPSPHSVAGSLPVVFSLSNQGTPYDDSNVDPFLHYTAGGGDESLIGGTANDVGQWPTYDAFALFNQDLSTAVDQSSAWC